MKSVRVLRSDIFTLVWFNQFYNIVTIIDTPPMLTVGGNGQNFSKSFFFPCIFFLALASPQKHVRVLRNTVASGSNYLYSPIHSTDSFSDDVGWRSLLTHSFYWFIFWWCWLTVSQYLKKKKKKNASLLCTVLFICPNTGLHRMSFLVFLGIHL